MNNPLKKINFSFLTLLFLFFFIQFCSEDSRKTKNPIFQAESKRGELIWIPVNDMHCRDGSSTGIGVELSSNSSQKNLIIYLRGGGACFDLFSCGNNDFSYGKDDFNRDIDTYDGILHNNNMNLFQDWHKIYVPYCTGDLHIGNTRNSIFLSFLNREMERNFKQITDSLTPEDSEVLKNVGFLKDESKPDAQYTGGVFFGKRNMQIVTKLAVEYFQENRSLEKIVVTGSSAGGFGTYFNYDLVATAFNNSNSNTKVFGIVDAAPVFDDPKISPSCTFEMLDILWGIDYPNDYNNYVKSSDYTGHKVSSVYQYLSQKYSTKQFGFLSHTQDETIRAFYAAISITSAIANEVFQEIECSDDKNSVIQFGNISIKTAGADIVFQLFPPKFNINGSTFQNSLNYLRDTVFSTPSEFSNWKVFYDYNSSTKHTFFPYSDTYYNQLTLSNEGKNVTDWIKDILSNTATHQRID